MRRCAAIYFSLVSLLIINDTAGQIFTSSHFDIHKLGDGVYAAIATKGGYAICNAGIIDLGDKVLIVDPFMTPVAAEDLKKAANVLIGKNIRYVVNTHYHNDHIGGNQVFKGATIISTKKTKELIALHHPSELAAVKLYAPTQLEKLNTIDTTKLNLHERIERRMMKGYFEALIGSSEQIKTVLPDSLVDKPLVLQGNKNQVVLMTYGSGHTESDLIVYLPQKGIAFLGDILFSCHHPWLGDGDMDKWRNYLDSIQSLKLKKIVPGHGAVSSQKQLDSMRIYFSMITQTTDSLHLLDKTPVSFKGIPIPLPFNEWYLSHFFIPNLAGEYRRKYEQK